jgi:amino acid permease
LFFIALTLHIPFIFYPAKESFLILIDELTRSSMSNQLAQRTANPNQQGKMKMAYKTMDYKRYLCLTLGLNLVLLILCIIIDNLGIMLDILSTFCCTALIFMFPSMFYLKAVSKAERESPEVFLPDLKINKYKAYFVIGIGAIAFVFQLIALI